MWYWRDWRTADIDIAKEPETRVSGGRVEFMCAVLSRRHKLPGMRKSSVTATYLDFWMVWRYTISH
jgi:hypothetical protein